MEKKQTYTYAIGNNLYINLTNRCTNKCIFCIRETKEGVGYDLWLGREPSAGKIIEDLKDLSSYDEVVFCGYGEPLLRLETLMEVAGHLKGRGAAVRVNTNGLANLIHKRNTVPDLAGLVDTISISLNAENNSKYMEVCRPAYGPAAYQSLLEYIKLCKNTIPRVVLSAVEWPGVDIGKCRSMAAKMGVDFRLRRYTGTPEDYQIGEKRARQGASGC